LERARQGAPRRDDLLEESHRVRTLCVDARARLQHVQRVPEPHDAREPLRAPVDVGNAPPAAQTAELGGLAADAEVTPGGELEASREAVPLDRGDRGLAGIELREPH